MDNVNEFPLCRLCLFKSRCVVDVFEENGRHGYIAAHAIEELLQLKVSNDDGYPQNVCAECLDKLTDFKIFKDQCKESRSAFDNGFRIGRVGNQPSADVVGEYSIKDEPTDEVVRDGSDKSKVFIKTELVDWTYQDSTQDGTQHPADCKTDCFDAQPNQSNRSQPIPIHPEMSTAPNEQPSASDWRPTILCSRLTATAPPKSNSGTPVAPYECTHCHKLFSYKSYLERHEQTHEGVRRHKCDVCHKGFFRANDLSKHKVIHTGERPFQCGICKKRFSMKSNMVMHQRTHSEEKAFKCDECGKGFNQNGNLLTHKRTHSGERPFVCKVCGRGFTHATNLKSHGNVHRRVDWKKFVRRIGGGGGGVHETAVGEKTVGGVDSVAKLTN